MLKADPIVEKRKALLTGEISQIDVKIKQINEKAKQVEEQIYKNLEKVLN